MARPPIGRDDQLSEMLRCRLRPAEYLRVQRDAQKSGMTLSDYSRRMLLSGTVTVRQTQTLDPEVFDQLRRIGINLNQAVRKLNATGRIPPELARASAVVESIILGIIDGS
ncbi:MAG: plasmid mobilization protein [Methylocella sp.]